jgi:hypothetical protein
MSSTKCDGLMMMMTKACCVDPTKWDKGKMMIDYNISSYYVPSE